MADFDINDFELNVDDFEVTPAAQTGQWQRPRREGLLGAAKNRLVRGGKAVADAIYPAAPAPPKPWGQFAKDTALGIGMGLMEAASAVTAPIKEAVRPAGEALGRKLAMTPEEVDAEIARLQAEKSRMMGDKTIMAVSPNVIEEMDTQLEGLRATRAKSLEQQAYERGNIVGDSAEMLGGAMFGKPFKWRGPVAAEAPAAAFVPRSIRGSVRPDVSAHGIQMDMNAITEPAPPAPVPTGLAAENPTISELGRMSGTEAARMGWYKGAEGSFQRFEPESPRPYEGPAQRVDLPEPELPRPVPPVDVNDFVVTERAAARTAPERPLVLGTEPSMPTAAEVRPTAPTEPSGLLDAQGRPVRRMPEPGQGTARQLVSPEVPEATPQPKPSTPLRDASQIAEERTGGALPQQRKPIRFEEPEDAQLRLDQEAESGIERALRGSVEQDIPDTPTTRLMRKGKGISGGSGVEDVGWVNPEGKELSHLGSESSLGGYDMTHAEAIEALHGQKNLGQALTDGWVRYAKAGNHLNIETGTAGIPRAIEYISRNGRSARGGVVLELTDPSGRMLESKMFDRPWQAIEYLKNKASGPSPDDARLNTEVRRMLAEEKARQIRPAKPISGGSDSKTIDDVIDTVSSNMDHNDPQDVINNVRAALDEARLPQDRAQEVVKAFGMDWEQLKLDAGIKPQALPKMPRQLRMPKKALDAAKRLEERPARPISGGSDAPIDQPLPSARQVGLRRGKERAAQADAEAGKTSLQKDAERLGIEYDTTPFDAPSPEAQGASKTPLRREFGSDQKTPLAAIEAIKQQLPEEVRNLVGSKRTPPGMLSRWKERLRRALPQEEFVNHEAPNSPVVTDIAWLHAGQASRVNDVLKKPWMQKVLKLDPEKIKDWEKIAADSWDASDKSPEAFERAIASWPEELKEYTRFRNEALKAETLARQRMKLDPVNELQGPYLPHSVDQELNQAVHVGGSRGNTSALQTTVKDAQHHRQARTMRDGEAAGVTYDDPRNAILTREWDGIRLTETERLMTSLKNRVLFETEEAAKAVSKTGEAIPVTGLPGADVYYAPTKAEALFLAQNLAQKRGGIILPGSMGNLKNYADTLFRNPNLFNPAPHITKNMWAKYILSSGDINPMTLVKDGIELFHKPDLDTVKLFREYMPYADDASEGFMQAMKLGPSGGDPAYMQFQHALVKGGLEQAAQRGMDFLGAINKPSSHVIFKWGDPAMRYSLFKKYISKGMEPQAAANHAWVDLVNYATRSDLVDFWKSIPMNFFVPWRVGSVTSVGKQILKHPVRAALVIGGVDMLREYRYRETGRWTHLPWDYFEGPLVTAAEAITKGNVSQLTFEVMSNALFGPAGEATAGNLKRMVTEPKDATEFGKQLMKVFWGLAQLMPSAEMAGEFAKFQKDGNPSHLVNAIMALLVAERDTKGFKTHSVSGLIPESVMPKDYSVKYKEMTNPANK